MSIAEIRHLLSRLLLASAHEPSHYYLWSLWRRVHQTIARSYHYQKRAKRLLNLQL